uniref:Uncharacterized protein n=1 Tax=Panagrolaimus davidi TaxID=227884 RepID=A0A914Q9T2_9BILA
MCGIGPGDNSGVDELFKSIQSYFTAPKGCLCICLGNKYDSEIRKKFIEAGKADGFTKVGITDWLSADYCALVSATDLYGKVETLKGLIYIFCGKTCRIWRKDNDRARFVKEIKYEDTIESLQEIKKIGEEKGKFPDLVIYGDKLKPHYEQAKNIFGRDKVTVYSELNQENGVLIKARIMGKDKDMKKYSTEVLLEQSAELKIGGVPITSAKMWQSLPFNHQIEIGKPDGVTDLEMFSYFKSNKKWLPNSKKFTVKFNIDVNGICSVDFDIGDEASNSNLKNQGKKYSSNNSLPTDSKPKFQPRGPGQQQQQRPRFNPPSQAAQGQQPQQPRGLQNNFTRGKHSVSTSSLASSNSENSTNLRGGRGNGRGRGGGNRGRGDPTELSDATNALRRKWTDKYGNASYSFSSRTASTISSTTTVLR